MLLSCIIILINNSQLKRMEYGELDLKQLQDENSKLKRPNFSENELLEFLTQIVGTLEIVQTKLNICHRDLKPK